jgi:hypothetical protein
MYETCNITNIYAEDMWNTNVLHKDMPNYTIYKIPYLVSSDALGTKGYVQYNYDAGKSWL